MEEAKEVEVLMYLRLKLIVAVVEGMVLIG